MIGLVYYADDPHKRVFRTVYPSLDEPDSILDDPQWLTDGVDPLRGAVMDKVAVNNGRKRGTPGTPATDPVVYVYGFDRATLTIPQWNTVKNFIEFNPQWNIINLGAGNLVTLTTGLISPCWIVVAGGGTPAVGTIKRSSTIGSNSIALWTA